ncbi:ornithine cyclodeaminase/alanine dehydrogenase-like protein (mu-crystallin family) [Sphingomonas sp. UYAg733]
MSAPIIGVEHLRTLLSYEDLIEPVSLAFQQSSAGQAENGLIVMLPGPDRAAGDVYVKTGTLQGSPVYIVKVSPWFAENVAQGRSQGGFVAVFDSRTGHTIALLDDQHYLSDIRTAAAGALAARLLAPAQIETAGLVGAGVQAWWQAQALYRERPFSDLAIWARDTGKAEALMTRLAVALPKVAIRVESDLEHVVRSSDVIVTTTLSREPLIRGDWLRPGQHITAVGADDSSKCELDAGVLRRGRVFVDSVETSVANGDVFHAIALGDYAAGHLAGELGDVLAGRLAGRLSDDDITIAKFVGIGAQDLAAARVVIEKLQLGLPATESCSTGLR